MPPPKQGRGGSRAMKSPNPSPKKRVSQSDTGDDDSTDIIDDQAPEYVSFHVGGAEVCKIEKHLLLTYTGHTIAAFITSKNQKVTKSEGKVSIVLIKSHHVIVVVGVDKETLKEILGFYRTGKPHVPRDTTSQKHLEFSLVCQCLGMPMHESNAGVPYRSPRANSNREAIDAPPLRQPQEQNNTEILQYLVGGALLIIIIAIALML